MVPPDEVAGEGEQPIRIDVQSHDAGQRLDQFLTSNFAQFSRSQLRRAINENLVQVDGRNRKPSHRVTDGEHVTLRMPDRPASGPEPEDIPLEILYEDEHLVGVNKPVGMVVHPAKGHWQGTLTAAITHHFNQLSGVGGPARPGIVHRLDRDTSGVILIAKTDSAHLGLAKQFEDRNIEKEYFAISRGTSDRDRDNIDQPIGVHPYQREKMAIRAAHSTSRDARTHYEVLGRYGRFTVFRVFPKTGRTHQIRVHLASIGCPIACDPLYSGGTRVTAGELSGCHSDRRVLLSRLALHAKRIAFAHPATGERIDIEAEIPPALAEFLAELQRTQKRLR